MELDVLCLVRKKVDTGLREQKAVEGLGNIYSSFFPLYSVNNSEGD